VTDGGEVGWAAAHSMMPPGSRMTSTTDARMAEPLGLGQHAIHPATAYLKLKPTAGLTRLDPRVYQTAGRLMGEQPVTAKPGHAPRDTMFARDNDQLPKDSTRGSEWRGHGFAYDYESGQQHVGKGDWRPVFAEDAVTAVKGTSRWTTQYPGRAYTHQPSKSNFTSTYQIPGAHLPWPAASDAKVNLLYQIGNVGARRPIGEPQHGGR
jgi:hypothetical protein